MYKESKKMIYDIDTTKKVMYSDYYKLGSAKYVDKDGNETL